jgi:hypothetical protein
MMVYTKYCLDCKHVLSNEEMSGSICNECKEKQINELNKEETNGFNQDR